MKSIKGNTRPNHCEITARLFREDKIHFYFLLTQTSNSPSLSEGRSTGERWVCSKQTFVGRIFSIHPTCLKAPTRLNQSTAKKALFLLFETIYVVAFFMEIQAAFSFLVKLCLTFENNPQFFVCFRLPSDECDSSETINEFESQNKLNENLETSNAETRSKISLTTTKTADKTTTATASIAESNWTSIHYDNNSDFEMFAKKNHLFYFFGYAC